MPESYSTEIDFDQRYYWGMKCLANGHEVWFDHPSKIGKLQFSNFGRVKSVGRVLIRKNGRKLTIREKIFNSRRVAEGSYIWIGGHLVHRGVLETFLGPCPEGMQCRHLDGNKHNNRINNLVWGTPKENGEDNIRLGAAARGEGHYRTNLTNEDIINIRKEYVPKGKETGCGNLGLLAKKYGVTGSQIRRILHRTAWSHVT